MTPTTACQECFELLDVSNIIQHDFTRAIAFKLLFNGHAVWTLAGIAFCPEALPNNLILYKICAYYIICRCVISKNNTGLRWYMATNWIMNFYEKVIKHHSLYNRLSCLIKMKQHFFLQIHIEHHLIFLKQFIF